MHKPQAIGFQQGVLRILVVVLALFSAAPRLHSNTLTIVGQDLPSPLPVAGKKIAFIFDDGPLPGLTTQVLDSLKRTGMRATFSVVGKNVEANPDIARRIIAEGHEIANQTWSHASLDTLSDEQILSEIQATEDVIYKTTGVHTRFFRPPDGSLTVHAADLIRSQGYEILQPTLDSGDWRIPAAGEVTRVILNGVTPGTVVLAHDSFPKSVAEIPTILDELTRRGFKSFTVSELRSQIYALE